MKGDSYMKRAPDYFNEEQQKIFNELIENIAGLIDIDYDLIVNFSFALEKLRWANRKLNSDQSLFGDRQFMAGREKFVKEVDSCLKHLDITPQARNKAKSETVKIQDPLTDLLSDVL